MTTNNFFNNDLRLLSNRKALEVAGLSKDNYEQRFQLIVIEKKYAVVIEALEGLYNLGIQHSCSLVDLLNEYNNI